ncbi:MAG: hypothetical protein Q8K43_02385 [Sulfurimicrobium sp.]|nr:hypothetical protein [Sulfurimicrobium sp.]MDP1703932.1 hypothetical protein [Sulfurimicrobium sp.]MDP1896713.1 hypothetical protein [Sulfurimicrobium sp.]MDP2197451.1 hypothetical protein [Sulfurimicrobium sp.]MDP3688887.1 hypothetical protein [Sulfurimicrobium sp.]
MNNHENQKGEMEKTQFEHDLADQTNKPVDASRRGFTKSGLAVSGVLLTLTSRPVLGDFLCKSPSGFLSGNVSASGTPTMCDGRTPGYWGTNVLPPKDLMASNYHQWPDPYTTGALLTTCTKTQNPDCWAGGTKFHGGALGFGGSEFGDKSMLQVILLGGNGDSEQLGAHCVAALLNAAKGWTNNVLTESQVRSMYNDFVNNGFFEPTAGVPWYAADIVAYLKTTMK